MIWIVEEKCRWKLHDYRLSLNLKSSSSLKVLFLFYLLIFKMKAKFRFSSVVNCKEFFVQKKVFIDDDSGVKKYWHKYFHLISSFWHVTSVSVFSCNMAFSKDIFCICILMNTLVGVWCCNYTFFKIFENENFGNSTWCFSYTVRVSLRNLLDKCWQTLPEVLLLVNEMNNRLLKVYCNQMQNWKS